MNKRIQTLSATFAVLLATAGPLYASGDHGHGHDKSAMGHDDHATKSGHKDHGTGHDDMFMKNKIIDGYDVNIHVMKNKNGKNMGGTHSFMIKVANKGSTLTDVVMNTKVKHPDGSSETKKTMKMGEWMMAGYDLGHKGQHQLMYLFVTPDGKKHKGGVYYP